MKKGLFIALLVVICLVIWFLAWQEYTKYQMRKTITEAFSSSWGVFNDETGKRARDVARKNDLYEIQTAIIVSQSSEWQRPWMNTAINWIPVSNIDSELITAWMTAVPTDRLPTNKVSWLWNATSEWEYLYIVAERNSVPNWWFALMAKSETEWWSNRVVCSSNEGHITTDTDLSSIKLCDTVSKWDSCSNSNGVCTYTSIDQLRYLLTY